MRILVLGATGMLGHRVTLELLRETDHEIIAHGNSGLPALNLFLGYAETRNCQLIRENLIDRDVSKVLDLYEPDFVINCAGLLKHNIRRYDVKDYLTAVKLNTVLPLSLGAYEGSKKSQMINFSTDCVFDGSKAGDYETGDSPNAWDLYGITKALGGTFFDSVRTSFIGYELTGNTSLLEWFLSNEGGEVSGYKRAMWSGVTTAHVARWVVKEIEKRKDSSEFGGYGQLSTTEPISKYELLCLIKEALNLDIEIIPSNYFCEGSVCNRSMKPDLWLDDVPVKWEKDSILLKDIVDEYEFYHKWREIDDVG